MKHYAIIWSDRAWKDLDRIFDFIAKDSRIEAEKQVFRIIDRGDQLAFHPESGPYQLFIKAELQARYLVLDNYKIIYFLDGDSVVIDTIFDTRQDPEKLNL